MKDADPQQRNKLLGGMKTVFVNAAKGTCRFHIVNMGWKKHVPPLCITNSNLAKWLLVVRKIQKWIYSWMTPGYIEDEDEYNISRHLLENFVCSLLVMGMVDSRNTIIFRIILKFLNCHVYTWEPLYHFFRQKHL
jgi:hypothetical protein